MIPYIIFLPINLIFNNHIQGSFSQTLGLDIYDFCSSNNDVCLDLESCPHLIEPVKRGFRPEICRFIGKKPIICCRQNMTSKSTNEDDFKNRGPAKRTVSAIMCEKYRSDICPNNIPFIQGGDPALEKELPFMAMIGFGSNIKTVDWQCGGTLLSPKWVLTAAHCLDGKFPNWVKLGDLDIFTDNDGIETQLFRVVRQVKHPSYRGKIDYNDIALLELNKEAKFNDYVRPICLHQFPDLPENQVVTAAGWGQLSYGGPKSDKLMKVDLEVFNRKECELKEILNVLRRGIDESMLCVGSREGGKDTCNRDSGGPIFLPPPRSDNFRPNCFLFTQVGITSSGIKCGEFPAIYTNVNYFREWIESYVWRPIGT